MEMGSIRATLFVLTFKLRCQHSRPEEGDFGLELFMQCQDSPCPRKQVTSCSPDILLACLPCLLGPRQELRCQRISLVAVAAILPYQQSKYYSTSLFSSKLPTTHYTTVPVHIDNIATIAAQTSSTAGKQSTWDKTKAKSSTWFQKVGVPVNKLSNKLGAEAFWPTSLDKEADKAAKILRSFCIDGFQSELGGGKTGSEKKAKKSLDHIPPEVIRNCKGLAIFTVMRMGLHWSGAGGSGIVISKLPDGSWSAPSGILIHTLGWGFVAGADIYDCVAVINNEKGMEGFTRVRATLGGEISAAVGPLGGGSTVDSEVFKRQAPVWTYTKSKGLYLGVQIDGTAIVERTSENERFYGVEKVRNTTILSGQVRPPGGTMVQLWETLQAAEGKSHDVAKLPEKALSPGDLEVEGPREESQREYEEVAGHHPEERMDHKA